MASFEWPSSGGGGVPAYANLASFPAASASTGTLAIALDTGIVYESFGGNWIVVAGPADILSVGTIDSNGASANGASDLANQLIMQSASDTAPGLVNLTTQTFKGNKTIDGTIAASNLSGTNTGDVTLAAFGSTPNANGLSLSAQVLNMQPADGTHPGGVSIAAQTIAGTKTFSSPLLISDGTLAAPGLAFSSENGTGWLRTGSGNPTLSVLDTLALDVVRVTSAQINFGFGTNASASGTNPFAAQTNYPGGAYFQYNNANTGSTSATLFQILNGTASTSVALNLENHAYQSAGFLAGACLVSAGPSCAPLFLIANEWASGGNLSFGVGGRAAANVGMVLSASGSTGLTLNSGWGTLGLSGSSSGIVSIVPQAAAGTFNFNLPVTAGTSGYALLSGGGGSSPMTWSAIVTNPMTTLGDLIYGGASGAATRLAGDTSNTRKFLRELSVTSTATAPVWDTLVSGDIPNNAANTSGTALNITATSNSTLTTLSSLSLPGSQVSSAVATATNLAGGSGGTIPYQSAAATTAMLANGTAGQILSSGGGTAAPTWSNPINGYNFLVNSAFDYWQYSTSAAVASTGGGTPTNAYQYVVDQWYMQNTLGGGTVEGIMTCSRVAGVKNGSQYGAKVQITTAPTGTGIQNGCALLQPLSNIASLPLYGQTASFSVSVLGLNNVNQVGITFMYATSEAKLTNTIGSEVLVTVNSSTFTTCTINGQALGTSQTASGIIGVRIRITGVSSGNTYDLNNGFTCEQAIVNLGSVASPYQRQYSDPSQELQACQFFYELSVPVGTGILTSTNNGMASFPCFAADTGGDNVWGSVQLKPKRVAASIGYWDQAGNNNKISTYVGSGSRTDNTTAAAATNGSTNSFWIQVTIPHLTTAYSFSWQADARI